MKIIKIAIILFCLTVTAHAATPSNIIPEVKSRASTNKIKKSDAYAQTTHIDRKTIEESPNLNLSELLRQQQSVVRLTNNAQGALSIRGFGDNASSNSLILIDGFPLTNPSILAPNLNSIALLDVERVDITQGSEGSLWGDQAVGGVVNIITRHPEKFMLDTSVGLGSFNKKFLNVLVGSKFKNGTFFKSFGLVSNTDNFRNNNEQTTDNVAVQMGMDYAQGMVSVNAQTYRDTVNFPGGLTQAQFEADPRQASNFVNHSRYKTDLLQLLNKQELNANWLFETRVSVQHIHGDGFIFSPFKRYEWTNYINPRIIGTINENKIIFGIQAQRSHYEMGEFLVDKQVNANQQHVYGQVIIPIQSRIDLTLGARAAIQNSQVEKIINQPVNSTNRIFVSEQGLSFRPDDQWSLYIRRDGNFRFPKANEMTSVPAGASLLKAQTGVSYEAGVTHASERQKTQLSIYQLDLNNEIAFDASQTPITPFGIYKNFNTTRRRGVTVTEQYQLTQKLMLGGQINLVDARFASGEFSGKYIPDVPLINANVNIDYEFKEQWHAKYFALYTGTRYASDDEKNVGKHVPGYWLNSVALQYMLPSVQFSFEINNVFNQSYSVFTIYSPITQTNTYFPGAGRNYMFTIKTNIG